MDEIIPHHNSTNITVIQQMLEFALVDMLHASSTSTTETLTRCENIPNNESAWQSSLSTGLLA
eukprot:2898450-Amphidinium_carterae.1